MTGATSLPRASAPAAPIVRGLSTGLISWTLARRVTFGNGLFGAHAGKIARLDLDPRPQSPVGDDVQKRRRHCQAQELSGTCQHIGHHAIGGSAHGTLLQPGPRILKLGGRVALAVTGLAHVFLARAFAQQRELCPRFLELRRRDSGIPLCFQDARRRHADALVQRKGTLQRFPRFVGPRFGISDGCLAYCDLGWTRSVAHPVEDGFGRGERRRARFHFRLDGAAVEGDEQVAGVDPAPGLDQHLLDGAGSG